MKVFSSKNRYDALRVDWNHPVSRNMLDCVLFSPAGNNGLTNLGCAAAQAAGVNITKANNPGGWKATNSGVGLNNPAPAANKLDWFAINNYTNYAAGDLSVRVRFVPTTWGTDPSYNAVFDKSKTVTFARELAAFIGPTGNITFIGIGGNAVSGIPLATSGFVLNTKCELVITRVASGGAGNIYCNGSSVGTFTLTNTAANNSRGLSIGRDSTGNFVGPVATYMIFNTWNRVLSPREVNDIWLDPFCFLKSDVAVVGIPTSVSFIPAWAIDSNVSVLGTGIY